MPSDLDHALSRHSVLLAEAPAEARPGRGVGAAVEPHLARWLDAICAWREATRREGRARFRPGAAEATIMVWTPTGARLGIRQAPDLHAGVTAQEDGWSVTLPSRPRRLRLRLPDATDADQATLDALLGRWATGHLTDRWLDPDPDDATAEHLDRVLGGALRAGTLDAADVPALLAAVEALRPHLRGAPEVSRPEPAPDRLFVPRHLLPDDLRRSLPAPLPGWSAPLVDTASLPVALADAVRAALPAPSTTILAGPAHLALAHMAEHGPCPDAVLSDPPYGSRSSDLAYRDHWPEGAWTALLREHLQQLHAALPPGAVGVLHIDEHRGAALETLAAEVMGDDFLGAGVWDKRNPKGDATGLATQHERLVWLCRDRAALKTRGGLTRRKDGADRLRAKAAALTVDGVTDEARAAYRRWLRAQTDLSGGVRAYQLLDDDGRVHRTISMAWPNKRRPPDAYFEPLVHPVTGQPCPVPRRGWRYPPATMASLLAEGRIRFGADHTVQPTRILHLDAVLRENVPSVIAWAGSDDTLQAALGVAFPYAKPVGLLRQLLDIVAPHEGAVVFDGFGGSGSTAHAAWIDAATHGPRRRVVLAERDPTVLTDVLLPRLLRALASDTWAEGRPTGAARDQAVAVRVLDPALADTISTWSLAES